MNHNTLKGARASCRDGQVSRKRLDHTRFIKPFILGCGIAFTVFATTPTSAQNDPAAPASLPAGTQDARTTATNELLRRAQVAIDKKDLREAVELYRRAKVNAQPLAALQPTVAQLRSKLLALGFEPAILDLPPSAPPAAAAIAIGTPGASPQPIQIPLGDASSPTANPVNAKAEALKLVATGRAALDRGDLATAQRCIVDAERLAVPESAFAAGEPRVWQLRLDVDSIARRGGSGVQQAGAFMPVGDGAMPMGGVVTSDFQTDGSGGGGVQQVQGLVPVGDTARGETLYRDGLEALSSGNSTRARELFTEAWKYESSMELATRNQLKEKLTLMQPQRLPSVAPGEPTPNLTPIQKAELESQAETRKVYREVTAELASVNEIQSTKPIDALERLEKLRRRVSDSKLDTAATSSMLTMVDRAISAQKGYVEANRGQIDLDLANATVEAQLASESVNKKRVDDEIAALVETFNDLMSQRRYPEAEVVAKKVSELSPDSLIAKSMFQNSRMGTRLMINQDIAAEKEDNFNKTMLEIDRAGIAIDPAREYQLPEARQWIELTQRRAEGRGQDNRLSTSEQEIKRRLSTPVDINYRNRPIGEVLQDLSAVTNIPVVMDARAMTEMRVSSDSPVTLELTKAIPLESALNLILGAFELTYVIENDVLNITSIAAKRSMVYPQTYRVTDLVTPIPNFASSYEDGLAGALRAAHQMTSQKTDVQIMPVSVSGLASRDVNGDAARAMNPNMMAQYANMGSQGGFGTNGPPGGGRGGMSLADFTSLIELIQTTVVPDTWEALGGPSTMREYPQNLSLVISTTSEVHDQITELLESLRRLQNLQVTIEVRFITLSDNFFERIGVDFSMSIDDNVNQIPPEDGGPSVVVGFNGLNGLPTTDFDVKLTQNNSITPNLGGFDTNAGAKFGFAILSDIEAFFFLQAAQGDARANILQAPKVTLFDGQLATISDVTQRPFVTSIIPVVGDFAVAQQPVIVVLNEGTQLNVQAIVSDDKRFVRLTLVPFFSQIGNVETFTFEGQRRRSTANQQIDPATGRPIQNDTESDVVQGTTVQLPQFAFTSVSTTVSVPDGGTILLGGIKRLSEERLERGVPILSKIPYVSRLFRNVAISRNASSLMLMVTPRIIIQEEEELAQTGFDPQR